MVHEDRQQSFLDVRRSTQEREEEAAETPMETIISSIPAELPRVPEDDENDWNIRPEIFDGEEGEEEQAEVDTIEELSQDRRQSGQPPAPDRNVRPRTEAPTPGEPESERGTSLAPVEGNLKPHDVRDRWQRPQHPVQCHGRTSNRILMIYLFLFEHFRRAGYIAVRDMKEAREVFTCILS